MSAPLPVAGISRLTPAKWETLEALAACGARGTTAMPVGPLHGAALAALVQFALAERIPSDRLGGMHYRIAEAGAVALARRAAAIEARGRPKQRPRGMSATMAHRDPKGDFADFFPTPPPGARAGAEVLLRLDPAAARGLWWEPACGAGHMVHGLSDFARVYGSDLYRYAGNPVYDFLGDEPEPVEADWIVSNPPFKDGARFIDLALDRARRGVAMLLRIGFLESIGRHDLLHGPRPLSYCATFSERLPMHRGRYDPDGTSAAFYAWFYWLKRSVDTPMARLARRVRRDGGGWIGTAIAPGTLARLARDSDRAFAVGGRA